MKIEIRKPSGKKYTHPLGYDCSTTSSWGFLQPICVREVNAQDTVNCRVGQVLRLNPQTKPVFGKFHLRTYSSFVKTADIYHAYESLLSGNYYNGAHGRYIPTKVPSLRLADLTIFTYLFSEIQIFACTGVTFSPSTSTLTAPTPIDEEDESTLGTVLFNSLFGTFSGFDATSRQYLFDDIGSYFQDASFNGYTITSGTEESLLTADWYYAFQYEGVYYLAGGRFNNVGRNLRKILIGAGYQLLLNTEEVEIVRLVAYYKAWFDQFAVQRNKTWKDTYAFSMMEMLEQYGQGPYNITSKMQFMQNFVGFMLKLSECYYTINPDYASAHIVGTSTDVASQANPNFSYLGADGTLTYSSAATNEQPILEDSADNLNVTPSGLKILEKLTKLVNVHTAVGGRIADYLRSVFNSEYVDEVDSIRLGSQDLPVESKPVFSTNESNMVALGEFAGQALGGSDGKESAVKFTAKAHGYFIQMMTVIPEAKMCQGIDPCILHKERFDFFHEEFDAITLLPSRKMNIYASGEFDADGLLYGNDLSYGFGNIPNYTEYKISKNILNGEMSMASRRSGYLPYTLDKLLPFNRPEYDRDTQKLYMYHLNPTILTAGEFWRTIGYYKWFGQFDRVFQNAGNEDYTADYMDDVTGRFDDNFIIQCYVDLSITGYELPMSKSFDTGAFENETMNVQKS